MLFKKRIAIIEKVLDEFKRSDKILLATTSLQPSSVVLLHIIDSIDSSIPFLFLNTGYHFVETLEFKDRLIDIYGFNIREVSSSISKSQQLDKNGRLLYSSNTDLCCKLNKTVPMEDALLKADVWISGIRRQQSAIRNQFSEINKTETGVLRYHPMLDWTSKDIFEYRKTYKLPRHPLEDQGYFSIGCFPCTQKPVSLDINDRSGRWSGLNKTECGLHTNVNL